MGTVFGRARGEAPAAREGPVLVFYNGSAGGGKGAKLGRKLQELVAPGRSVDVRERSPHDVLLAVRDAMEDPGSGEDWRELRVLAVGGDGTVGSVLEAVMRLEATSDGYRPPVGVVPMGTGNDLARCLGWIGAEEESPARILKAACEAPVTSMDAWQLNVTGMQLQRGERAPPSLTQAEDGSFSGTFFNYLSVGPDAETAREFDGMRRRHPSLLSRQATNQVAYAAVGAKFVCCDLKGCVGHTPSLAKHGDLEVKRGDPSSEWVPVEGWKEGGIHGLVALSVPSYAGGRNLWGRRKDGPRVNDGQLTLTGFRSMARLACALGFGRNFHGEGLGRAVALRLRLDSTTKFVGVQVDGEPFHLRGPADLEITSGATVSVLQGPRFRSDA